MLIYFLLGMIIMILTVLSIIITLVVNNFEGNAWMVSKILCIITFIWMAGFFLFMEYGGLFN